MRNHLKKDRLFEIAERRRLPVVLFAEGGGGRPGDVDWPIVAGLDCRAFHLFARLSGLVRGKFRGIEILRRGVSPRIVSAEVLGSTGATPVSGPELEARLGLADSWAYFGVKHGASVIAEPDLSGQPPSSPSPASPSSVRAAAPRSASARRHRRVTVTGPQGGTPAPVRPPSTLAGGSEAG